MIMLLPVHTALWNSRPTGAFVVLVALQLSVIGLYLPPVFTSLPLTSKPPHTIISLPVQMAVESARAVGAFDRSSGPTIRNWVVFRTGVCEASLKKSAPHD